MGWFKMFCILLRSQTLVSDHSLRLVSAKDKVTQCRETLTVMNYFLLSLVSTRAKCDSFYGTRKTTIQRPNATLLPASQRGWPANWAAGHLLRPELDLQTQPSPPRLPPFRCPDSASSGSTFSYSPGAQRQCTTPNTRRSADPPPLRRTKERVWNRK